jgi:hypothetical protein
MQLFRNQATDNSKIVLQAGPQRTRSKNPAQGAPNESGRIRNPKGILQLCPTTIFDRTPPPYLEMEGEGIVEGFIALCTKHQEEGVQIQLTYTFTGFTLHLSARPVHPCRATPD